MIPEKWDKVCLYASIIDTDESFQTGELFFYYIPKGIIRRKPINVYEIPAKFNLNEEEYNRLAEILYNTIKELREEFELSEQKLWSNVTIIIKDTSFRIEYNYDDLLNDIYTNEERHIIWKYKYLDLDINSCNKEEKRIIEKYEKNRDLINKNEVYESGIYIKNVKNIVDYETAGYDSIQNVEYVASKDDKVVINQILGHKP